MPLNYLVQGRVKSESVSDWIQTIQRLGLKFRETDLHNCEPDEKVGILSISYKLRNTCFVQGLSSYRIQMIMTSSNHEKFDEIAETVLEKENAIRSSLKDVKARIPN
jgi:hypothetical protein